MNHRTLCAFLLSVAAIVALGGCALSINPIVRGSDSIYDARLIGNWEEAEGTDWATIANAIDYTSNGKRGKFEGWLGRLGELMILDVSPAKQKGELPNPAFSLMVAGHLFLVLAPGNGDRKSIPGSPLFCKEGVGGVRARSGIVAFWRRLLGPVLIPVVRETSQVCLDPGGVPVLAPLYSRRMRSQLKVLRGFGL